MVEILKSPIGPTPVTEEQIENVHLLKKHVGDCFCGKYFVFDVFVRVGPVTGLRGVVDRLDRKILHIHIIAIPGSVMIDIEPYQLQLERDSKNLLVTSR